MHGFECGLRSPRLARSRFTGENFYFMEQVSPGQVVTAPTGQIPRTAGTFELHGFLKADWLSNVTKPFRVEISMWG
jgi:hypothetical protein